MNKKLLLIAIITLIVFSGIAIILITQSPKDEAISFSEYATVKTYVPERHLDCIVVSSNELQSWIEDDYDIKLGDHDYSTHSLILSFNQKLKSFVMHRGEHAGWYKPTVRSASELNLSTPYFEKEPYKDIIFVYTTDRTDIVSEDEYEFTLWD